MLFTKVISGLFNLSPTTMVVLAAIVVAGLAWLYNRMLPQVYPGIPYNKSSARNILGDLPAMYAFKDGPMRWMTSQTEGKGYPLHQVLRPFGMKPMVILSDFREAQDICMRRPEFDRAEELGAFYKGLLPTFHGIHKTDATWKSHRRLLQDLMSPAFLNDVAAPDIYSSIQILIEVWKEKARICGGRPFKVGEDIKLSAFDAILAFSFGQRFPARAMTAQAEYVRGMAAEPTSEKDAPVTFKETPSSDGAITALMNVTDLIGLALSGPKAVLTWPFTLMKSSNKKLGMDRALFLKAQFTKAGERLEAGGEAGDENEGVKYAIDMMVKREKALAENEARDPKYWSQTMHDEMLGFLVAGHDTTAATEKWALKYLTNHQDVQKKLRAALREAHSSATAEGRMPSSQEIAKTSIPYLDAFVEETLRLANSVFGVDRQAYEDATVLGQRIPKGTMMFIVNSGPSFTKPGFEIAESDRSESCQQSAKDRGVREWDPENMGVFQPERWLTTSTTEDGKEEESFNLTAGPALAFGLGMRGCFGRRLAYLSLKLTISLLVWNFEMQEVPEELSDYSAVDGLTHCPKNDYVRLQAVAV